MVSRLECTRVHFVQVSVLVSRPKKGLDINTGMTGYLMAVGGPPTPCVWFSKMMRTYGTSAKAGG